jgi:L-amino acid N-acyltransferase YncA
MIEIRLARAADGEALAAIYRPAVSERATSFEVDPPDALEMSQRVTSLLVTHPWLVCAEDGRTLGYAYASRHRERAAYQWSVEVSAYVHQGAHRRGVATGLYTSLFAVLCLLGYRNAFAGITLPNEASVRFHEAAGFVRIGTYRRIGWKLGAWHDVLWLQRDLAPHVAAPPAPTALSCVEDHEALRHALASGLGHVRSAL